MTDAAMKLAAVKMYCSKVRERTFRKWSANLRIGLARIGTVNVQDSEGIWTDRHS